MMASQPRLRILSLSTVFPNPSEPGLGPFIRARLSALGAHAEVCVIAPIAPFDYDNPKRPGLGRRSVPFRRQDGPLEVYSPAWCYLPGGRFVNGILLGVQVIRLVRRLDGRNRFDVLDAHFAHPEGVAACLLAAVLRRPFVVTLRGSEPRHSGYPLRRRLMAWALKRASAVFAVSSQLGQLAAELGARPHTIRMVGNGVAPDFSEAARRFGPAGHGSPYTILSIGRLSENKGHQHVIRVVAQLRRSGIPVRLRIIGEAGRGIRSHGPDLEKLIAQLDVSEHVEMAGWMPQSALAEAMAQADVMCLASHREGWPNVVHEALACGTPVVAFDVGSVATLIPDERYGFVVPREDCAALQQALERALNKSWDRSAIAAWGGSRTWETVAQELLPVLREVAGAKH